MTTSNNTLTVFPMEPKTRTKIQRGIDYDIRIDTKKYAITVEPMANHIHCETIVKILGYRDLVKKDAPAWKK